MDFRVTKLRDTDNPSKHESYMHTKLDKHALKFTNKHKQAKLEFPTKKSSKKTESVISKGTHKTESLDYSRRKNYNPQRKITRGNL